MNELIRKLSEQARKYARDYVADCKHYGYYMEHNEYDLQFEEKFAELIVKECVGIVVEQKKWVQNQQATFNYDDDLWDRARIQQSDRIIGKIREHFGIKE